MLWDFFKMDLAIVPDMEYNNFRGDKCGWIYDCKRSSNKMEYFPQKGNNFMQ